MPVWQQQWHNHQVDRAVQGADDREAQAGRVVPAVDVPARLSKLWMLITMA